MTLTPQGSQLTSSGRIVIAIFMALFGLVALLWVYQIFGRLFTGEGQQWIAPASVLVAAVTWLVGHARSQSVFLYYLSAIAFAYGISLLPLWPGSALGHCLGIALINLAGAAVWTLSFRRWSARTNKETQCGANIFAIAGSLAFWFCPFPGSRLLGALLLIAAMTATIYSAPGWAKIRGLAPPLVVLSIIYTQGHIPQLHSIPLQFIPSALLIGVAVALLGIFIMGFWPDEVDN